jgi:hypothetical protein
LKEGVNQRPQPGAWAIKIWHFVTLDTLISH